MFLGGCPDRIGKAVAKQEFVTAHALQQSDARLHTAAAFQQNRYAIQTNVAAPLARLRVRL